MISGSGALVYFWGFCPFQLFIVPIHRAITKNIGESATCGKSNSISLRWVNYLGLHEVYKLLIVPVSPHQQFTPGSFDEFHCLPVV